MTNRVKKLLAGVLALAALAVGGAAISSAATHGNSTTTPNAASSPSNAAGSQTQPAFTGPAHSTPAHEDAEKPVTGDAATKAQAAAVKFIGSGTAGTVTTDFSGNGYEVTVTKADGSQVEVHLDSSFNAFAGGPRGHDGMPPQIG